VDETTPLRIIRNARPLLPSKLRARAVVRDYQQKDGFELGSVASRRSVWAGRRSLLEAWIGLQIGPVFFHLGG